MAANPSNLQVTPCIAPIECTELNFQGLFLFHTPLGQKANQAKIIDGNGPMGTTAVNNWTVCDGLMAPGQMRRLLLAHKACISKPVTGSIPSASCSRTKGGIPRDITEAPMCVESITVRSGAVIDSIGFSYVDYDGQEHSAGPWGGSTDQPHTIQLADSEFITEMSGTISGFNGVAALITSIKFVTNLQTYGPFGQANGTPFTVPVQPGGAIVGFFRTQWDLP